MLIGGAGLGLFFENVEEAHALDLHLVGQHKGDAVLPGHAQARRHLAGADVVANVLALERMAHIAHHRLAFVGGGQLQVLVDAEGGRGPVGGEPLRHRGAGRALRVQALERQVIDGAVQVLEKLLGLGIGCGIDHQPAVGGVDPAPGDAAAAERPRHQFIGHLVTDFQHLLAPDRIGLLARHLDRLFLGALADHRRGQQLLFDTKSQHPLLALGVQIGPFRLRRQPAAAFHVKTAARLQRLQGEGLFQHLRFKGKLCRKAIDDQVFKPH